jgi:hypothetical protein
MPRHSARREVPSPLPSLPVNTSTAGPLTAGTIATDQQLVVVPRGGEATFGRDSSVDLRVGHAPVHDDVVPRRSGKLFTHDGRLVVANLDDSLAFDIRVADRPAISIPPGDWHSPRDHTYDIVINGALTYTLTVTVNTEHNRTQRLDGEEIATQEPPTGARPRLTERQRQILDAYVAPQTAGRRAASHQEVAQALGISRSLVRLECHRIWSELFLAGVPMRDLGDARDEIADAWARHRI